MDEIDIGPRHDFRSPSSRWLVVATAVALIAATATLIMTSGRDRRVPRPQGPSSAAATPTRSAIGAPGTLLLTCESANWGDLGRNWRAGSLKVGPLWLVGGRRFAYMPRRRFQGARPAIRRPPRRLQAVMIVEVSDGATVVMRAADKAGPYFHFVDGFDGSAGNPLPKGDTGFTFRSCPKGDTGPNGRVTDFYLGFSIESGRAASVDVQASVSSRPVQLIFTIPRHGSAA